MGNSTTVEYCLFVTRFNVISDLMTWFVWSQIFLGFCSVNFFWFSDTWFYGKTSFNSRIYWSLQPFSWNLVAENSFIQSHRKGFSIFVIFRSGPYWQWIGMDEEETRREAERMQRARETQGAERDMDTISLTNAHLYIFVCKRICSSSFVHIRM